jgi:haloacetate dehalogenase
VTRPQVSVADDRPAVNNTVLPYSIAGSGGKLVVLILGWPQTGACWRHVIEPLAQRHTVLIPEIYRGSSSSPTGADKRAIATALSGLVKQLGHDSTIVVGHDRGARVAHRWALDQPSQVSALVVLDVLPTRVVMQNFDIDSASAMWHWFFHRNVDLAQHFISSDVEGDLRFFFTRAIQTGAIDAVTFNDYVEAYRDPAVLRSPLND